MVGAEGTNADSRDHAGVHTPRDGDHGPAPAELPDGFRRPLGEPVEAGGGVEGFDGSV